MSRFVEGKDRTQVTLIPECLADLVAEDNPVRVVDAFVQELDLSALSFKGTMPASKVRPAYDPALLPMIYMYGFLNRVQCRRRLLRDVRRPIAIPTAFLPSQLLPAWTQARRSCSVR